MKREHEDRSVATPAEEQAPEPLSVEELEARIAPSAAIDKKVPVPPPYPPGALYGLVRRDSLRD